MAARINQVSVADAKRTLSELLGRVAYGKETITIAKRGRPMAKLVPISESEHRPHLADVKGWLKSDHRFFRILDGIVRARHGRIRRPPPTFE